MNQKKPTVMNFPGALKRLQDTTTELSARGVSALSNANKRDLAAFAHVWIDLPVERRQRIARMMVELAEQDFKLDYELLFRYFLNDVDATVRVAGIEGLWESEDAALVKPMIGFLRSDPNARARAAAADSLGRFMLLAEYGRLPETHAILIGEALLSTIRSANEDLVVRCRSVEALAYWSEDIVKEIIDAAYEDPAPEMRASAIAAMGRTADSMWRKTVLDELESPDPRMRFEAARSSGELENREATPRLIELLEDPDREVQTAALTALGQVGGKMAKNALIQAAASNDEVLSALATEALQELDFADSGEFLLLDMEPHSADDLDESENADLELEDDDDLEKEENGEWDDDNIEEE
jgi:HEAT repeat protein